MHNAAAETGREVTFCPLYAQQRLAQSNLVLTDVELVRHYGRMIYRNSAQQYFIGKRDFARYGAVEPRLRKLHSLRQFVGANQMLAYLVMMTAPGGTAHHPLVVLIAVLAGLATIATFVWSGPPGLAGIMPSPTNALLPTPSVIATPTVLGSSSALASTAVLSPGPNSAPALSTNATKTAQAIQTARTAQANTVATAQAITTAN